MKDNKTPYLVLFLGIISVLSILISTFSRAYAFYTSFYTTSGFNVIGRKKIALLDTGLNINEHFQSVIDSASSRNADVDNYEGLPVFVATPSTDAYRIETCYGDGFGYRVDAPNSPEPIYVSNCEEDAIWFLTMADQIYLNPDSSSLFGARTDSLIGSKTEIDEIDLQYFNTSLVTNMYAMFGHTESLQLNSTSLSNWDTSNVTDMSYMFYESSLSMSTLNLSSWNTKSVTNMESMFSSSGIRSLDVSGWNTYKVTDMDSMFSYASQLSGLNLSSWNVSNVQSMVGMFQGIKNLGFQNLNLQGWNAPKLTTAGSFLNTSWLSTLSFYGANFSNLATTTNMLGSMTYLNHIATPASIKSGSNIILPAEFYYNGNIYTKLNSTTPKNVWMVRSYAMLNTGKTLNTQIATYVNSIVSSCDGISKLEICNGGSTCNLTYAQAVANGYTNRTINTSNSTVPIYMYGDGGCTLYFYTAASQMYLNPDASLMFTDHAGKLEWYNVGNINTFYTTNMYGIFNNTRAQDISISDWKLNSVTNMAYMFNNSTSFYTTSKTYGSSVVDLSSWNTSKVTNMFRMFHNTTSVTSLNLSGWSVRDSVNAANMFRNMNRLKTLDMYGLDFDLPSSVSYIFTGVSNLTSLRTPKLLVGATITLPKTMYYSGTAYTQLSSSTPRGVWMSSTK